LKLIPYLEDDWFGILGHVGNAEAPHESIALLLKNYGVINLRQSRGSLWKQGQGIQLNGSLEGFQDRGDPISFLDQKTERLQFKCRRK